MEGKDGREGKSADRLRSCLSPARCRIGLDPHMITVRSQRTPSTVANEPRDDRRPGGRLDVVYHERGGGAISDVGQGDQPRQKEEIVNHRARLAYPQHPGIKDTEMVGKITCMVFQDPPHYAHLYLSARTGHPQEKHPSVRMTRMVHQFAKIGVHRDDNAIFTHRPQQNVSVAHARVNVTDKSRVIARLTQIINHRATDVKIYQEVHLRTTYAG